jgi:hypothetical protein
VDEGFADEVDTSRKYIPYDLRRRLGNGKDCGVVSMSFFLIIFVHLNN